MQLGTVRQVVWPDSDATSGKAEIYYPMREVGSGRQDAWAELQAAAGQNFLEGREKSSALHRGPGRVNDCPLPPGALLVMQQGLPALLNQKQKEDFWRGG